MESQPFIRGGGACPQKRVIFPKIGVPASRRPIFLKSQNQKNSSIFELPAQNSWVGHIGSGQSLTFTPQNRGAYSGLMPYVYILSAFIPLFLSFIGTKYNVPKILRNIGMKAANRKSFNNTWPCPIHNFFQNIALVSHCMCLLLNKQTPQLLIDKIARRKL